MIRLAESIIIERQSADVFRVVADPRRDPEWNDAIVTARLTSSEPIATGTTFEYQTEFLGRRLTVSAEMTAYELDRRACVRTTGGVLRSAGCRVVEMVTDGRTRLTVTLEAQAVGPLRLAEGMAAEPARRQLVASLARLKRLLEAEGEAP